MGSGREKAGPAKGSVVETRTVEYLPAGVGVTPERGKPSLDPELEKLRDAEIKANDVPGSAPLGEPTIDPELVKAREAEIERDAKRAGVKVSDTSVGKSEAAKKAAPSKSSK